MSLQTAPYNDSMRIGSGFNSYTQQLCVDNAVVKDDKRPGGDQDLKPKLHTKTKSEDVSQQVTFTSKFVESSSEVTEALNVSGSLEIKYGGIGVKGSGSYVDSSKVKENDINYFVQVKVVNQQLVADDVNKFNTIPNISATDAKRFTDVYGDSYISGFLEGGEFNALLSVKVKDKSKLNDIKGELSLSLEKAGFGVTGKAAGGKTSSDISQHAETTITVAWSGGGKLDTADFQEPPPDDKPPEKEAKDPKDPPADTKKPVKDGWTIQTMAKAAFTFADRVRDCPQRTHAILTKYTALRSYQLISNKGSPLDYENAGVYTSSLLEAYLDYKSIWKQIQGLSKPQESLKLVEAPASIEEDIKELKDSYAEILGLDNKTEEDKKKIKEAFKHLPETHYKDTVVGVEKASRDCRLQMIRIVAEVDAVAKKPEVAVNYTRVGVYLNPLLFRQLLPVPRPRVEDPVKRSYIAEGQYNIKALEHANEWFPEDPKTFDNFDKSTGLWVWNIIAKGEHRYMIMNQPKTYAICTPDPLVEDSRVSYEETSSNTTNKRFLWYIEFHSMENVPDIQEGFIDAPTFIIRSAVDPRLALSYSEIDGDWWTTLRDSKLHQARWAIDVSS